MITYITEHQKRGSKMPNYTIIASDLDGTILRDDKTISQENLDAIKKFTEMGGIFVPTTGRAIGEVPDFLLNNPDIRYIICSDGTGIYDKQTGRCEFDAIPHDLLMRAIDIFLSFDTHIVIHHNNAAYSDITQELFSSVVFPGDPSPRGRRLASISEGDLCNVTELSMCAQNGTHIVSVAGIHVEPMGIYGGKQASLDAIK